MHSLTKLLLFLVLSTGERDKQRPDPITSAELNWVFHWNGINARLLDLAGGLHQCLASSARYEDASPALPLSALTITSAKNHVLHCLLWHLNIPQRTEAFSRRVCAHVCVCVCVSPQRAFTANQPQCTALLQAWMCLQPNSYPLVLYVLLSGHCIQCHQGVSCPTSPVNRAVSKWRLSHNFHSQWTEWSWKKFS